MSCSVSYFISNLPFTGMFFHTQTVMKSIKSTKKTLVCNTTQYPGANEINSLTFIKIMLTLKGVSFNPPADRNAQNIRRRSAAVIWIKLTHPR